MSKLQMAATVVLSLVAALLCLMIVFRISSIYFHWSGERSAGWCHAPRVSLRGWGDVRL